MTFTQILLTVFAVVLGIVFLSILLNRLIFKISFRNISRRKSTALLVIFGSMIGTALLTGSLIINDSFKYTADVAVKDSLGPIDAEIVTDGVTATGFSQTDLEFISRETKLRYADSEVLPIFANMFPIREVLDDDSGITLENVTVISADWDKVANFGEDELNSRLAEPGVGSALISKAAASRADIAVGDTIEILLPAGNFKPLKISEIYDAYGATAYSLSGTEIALVVNPGDFSEIGVAVAGLPGNWMDELSGNILLVTTTGKALPENYSSMNVQTDLDWILKLDEVKDRNYLSNERKDALRSNISANGISELFTGLSFLGVVAGGLLIYNLYSMLADERKSELGIMRALGFKRFDLIKVFAYEGFFYAIISSFVGVLFGIGVGYGLITGLSYIFSDFLSEFQIDAIVFFNVTPLTAVISVSLGFILTFVTILYSSFRFSRLNIVSAIRDTEDEPDQKPRWRVWIGKFIMLLVIVGTASIYFAADAIQRSSQAEITGVVYYFSVVVSTLLLSRLINKKFFYTLTSIFMFGYSVYAFSAESFKATIEESPVIFVLIGLGLIAASTVFLTFNIELIGDTLAKIFSPIRSLAATVKIAMRYPASKRSRTALTITMYSLVIFMITVISVYDRTSNQLLGSIFGNILGGYNGLISYQNPDNRGKITEYLQETGKYSEIRSAEYAATTDLSQPQSELPPEAPAPMPTGEFFLADASFISENQYEVSEAKEGTKVEDAWGLLSTDSRSVLVSKFYVSDIGPLAGRKVGDTIKMGYFGTDVVSERVIVGVLDSEFVPFNMAISRDSFNAEFVGKEQPELRAETLFKFADGVSKSEASKELKSELARVKETAFLPDELVAPLQKTLARFLYLMQGFLAFSLLVGLAGVAIIMIRSVNERRQQIGMLRSIGFQRNMILTAFLIESGLVGILGVIIGVVSGIVASTSLINSFVTDELAYKAVVPYLSIGIFSVSIIVATLLFALWPAWRASRLSPVEATNYAD